MRDYLLFLLYFTLSSTGIARSAPCLRLAGVVQDYATRQPLAATLFLKTATGRIRAATSAEGSGAFSMAITCPVTALIVERDGYRPQSLPIDNGGTASDAVHVLIPLVAVVRQTSDRPYQQSEQTFYEQQSQTNAGHRSQRGTFVIVDALTNTPLQAQTCLFSTNTQTKRCFDTDRSGQFETRFDQRDIVAMEVSATGYQPYAGNLIVERLDGRTLRHDIRLLRQLTLVAVFVGIPSAGLPRCELRTEGGAKVIPLMAVPGSQGWFCSYDLLPQRYQLLVRDAQGREIRREPLALKAGLNTQRIVLNKAPALPIAMSGNPKVDAATPPAAPAPRRKWQLPDELPLIYFAQSSYVLSDDSKDVLQQVAEYLHRHPEYHVKLIGHTDPEGDERLNQYLSEFRAKVIASYLFGQGIPDQQMTVSGQGSRYPISPSDVEENKAKNRRVYLKLEVTP